MEREPTSGCARTILLADNKPDFLATYQQLLQNTGFRVLTAGNPVEAEQILLTYNVHLAILDKRLERDDDILDTSGMALAARLTPSVPKVIITTFVDADHAAEILRRNAQRRYPAVDFINKRELSGDSGRLLERITQDFENHVELNWDLAIYRQPEDSLRRLVSYLGSELSEIPFEEQYCEVVDLFRRLFREEDQITLDAIVLYGSDYALLKVFTSDGVNRDQYIVSCGRLAHIEREQSLYDAAVPRLAAFPGLRLNRRMDSVHFGVLAFHVHGGVLEEAVPLNTLLWRGQTENALDNIDAVLTRQLNGWHEKGGRVEDKADLADYYSERLPGKWAAILEKHVQSVSEQILNAGIGRCDHLGRTLQFYLTPSQPVSYPNPAIYWSSGRLHPHSSVIWGRVHGNVRADTVLIGRKDVAWLIDFSAAGEGPLIHDYVTLEADLKRRHAVDSNLLRMHMLETRLLAKGSWPDKLNAQGLPAVDAALLGLLGRIRLWAASQTGCSEETYLTALYYVTATDLAEFEPDQRYVSHRLKPFAQALLSASMVCGRLAPDEPGEEVALPQAARTALWLDMQNRQVWVEGRAEQLSPQDFELLSFMNQRAGQLCTRKELHEVLGIPFDRYQRNQDALNSAMSRLRGKIEPDPKRPHYLLTVRSQGYKLNAPVIERQDDKGHPATAAGG